MKMNILSPSMLAADFAILGKQLEEIKANGGTHLHVDVMDGDFVPSISFGMCVIESIRKASDLIFDVHLMVREPIRYIDEFVKDGADIITVHLEACSDVKATLEKIRSLGVKAGLSIKPGTDVEEVRQYLPLTDMILVMSVEPGFGGQEYIEASTDRIRQVRDMITEGGYDIDVEVDGGIRMSNLSMILDAGANVIVAGSAIFKGDIAKNMQDFLTVMSK